MITTIDFGAACRSAEMRARWQDALDPVENLYAMYLSPDWLESGEPEDVQSCLLQYQEGPDGTRRVVSLLRPGRSSLRFELSHLLRKSVALDAIEVLGSQILGVRDPSELKDVVADMWRAFPKASAIYLKSVRKDSALWGALEASGWNVNGAVVYRQHGNRPFHYVQLPGTFDEYMEEFPKKQRYNLKRQVRRMAEAFGEKLEVRRVASPEDIPFFVTSARAIVSKSWKARKLANAVPKSIEREALLRSVAERDLLRSYVLLADGAPAAFIVGYQYRGVYHYADLAYDESYAKHSPGAVLLLMVIEQLVGKEGTQSINFGITDAQFKHVFGNRHTEDAEILILRPGLKNRMLVAIHKVFQRAKLALRALVARGRKED